MRLGRHEAVRRVYPVFQDRNWTARPWVVEHESIERTDGGFVIDLGGHGTFDATGFGWTARIEGRPEGVLTLDFTGVAETAFLRNRLGLCVLTPVRDLAGAPVRIGHTDGTQEQSHFPARLSPNQPFLDLRSLSYNIAHSATVTVAMEGEVFESEDHRNWSDASTKFYCTPIGLPFPVEVRPGDTVQQQVTITAEYAFAADAEPPLAIVIADRPVPMPALGIGLDADRHRLTAHEVELLRALELAHVRGDVGPTDDLELVSDMSADAQSIGARLVVALDGADPATFASLRDDPGIDRWLVFDPATKVTDPLLVEQAQQVLGSRVGGGTNLYFTELNRGRPAGRGLMSFSVNPQVHSSDDLTVMQNAWTLEAIAREARALYPADFLELSPLTLRPRWNPNATDPQADVSSTPLPSRVDARQCADFAAAWAVLALSAIVRADSLDAVTLFAATGWEGIIERAEGSPSPTTSTPAPGSPFRSTTSSASWPGAGRCCPARPPTRTASGRLPSPMARSSWPMPPPTCSARSSTMCRSRSPPTV